MVLTNEIFQQLVAGLNEIDQSFGLLLAPFKDISAQNKGIDANQLNLKKWPDIKFNFVQSIQSNSDGTISKNTTQLICLPSTYWQINSPSKGKACFKILTQLPNWPNQSIIGLPLINNYYTIFDRSIHKTGVIKFATIK